MDDIIVLNVKFEGDNEAPEIFRLQSRVPWIDLKAMLQAQYDCENIEVFYIDSEGDYITLSSDDEYVEAKRMARQCSNTLHMKVRNLGDITPPEIPSDVPIPLPAGPIRGGQNTVVKIPPWVPEIERMTEEVSSPPLQQEMDRNTESVVIQVDMATGERTEVKSTERLAEIVTREEASSNRKERDEETGAYDKGQPVVKKKKRDTEPEMERSERRVTQSVDRATRSRRRAYDADSGECHDESQTLPYSVFVKYMEEMKKDLQNNIVKDITKKTVKQVLKGLDGAVIQSVKGSESADPGITTVLPKAEKNPVDPILSHPIYYHNNVYCDFCEKVILGVRYKCCNCIDYDLCEECEGIYGVHDPNHVFLKLRKPIKLHRKSPLMKHILYKMYQPPQPESEEIQAKMGSEEIQARAEAEQGGAEGVDPLIDNLENKSKAKMERIQAKIARKREHLKEKERKLVDKQKRKEERIKQKILMQKLQQKEKPVPEGLATNMFVFGNLGAKYLGDVTVEDGTHVQPGTKLLKTWKMKNNGKIAWRETTKLKNVYGDIPTPQNKVDVPPLKPGEEGHVSVTLIAPDLPGKYQSHWKMVDSGVQFGHRVWCDIVVEPKAVLEPQEKAPLHIVKETEDPEDSGSNGNVKVALRCRPLTWKEKKADAKFSVVFDLERPAVVVGNKTMTFDYVFQPVAMQTEIYFTMIEPLLDRVLEGCNAAVLGYGQKRSGRTYTMMGEHGDMNAGVIPNTMKGLFSMIERVSDAEYTVRLSYVEDFQDQLFDLLVKNPRERRALKVRSCRKSEGCGGETYIEGATKVEVRDYKEALQYLPLSADAPSRFSYANYMNYHSNESSYILTLSVERRSKTDLTDVRLAELHLVDMKRSDRKKRSSGAASSMLREGAKIQRSSSSFGNVVSALTHKQSKFIPYRECKLTRILEDCLGGNGHLVFLACISPADSCEDETISTLRLASRVKKIKNHPVINRVMAEPDPHMTEIRDEQEEVKVRAVDEVKVTAVDEVKVKAVDDKVEVFLLERKSEEKLMVDLTEMPEENTVNVEDYSNLATVEVENVAEVKESEETQSDDEEIPEEIVVEKDTTLRMTPELDDSSNKLEQDLNCAVAAVAQLKLEEEVKDVSAETGQDLMSFEMLGLVARGPSKISQTATPNNTPLVVSPPKSPTPEMATEREETLSTSSVEIMNTDIQEEEEAVLLEDEFVPEKFDFLHGPVLTNQLSQRSWSPDREYFSTDDESLSEDDDFVLVPLPPCFDTSKPIKSSYLTEDFSASEEDEDPHGEEERDGEVSDKSQRSEDMTHEVSVDDILTASGSLPTPPLNPEVNSPLDPVISPPCLEPQQVTVHDPLPTAVAMVTAADVETVPAEGEFFEALSEAPEGEKEIGASGDIDHPPLNTETGEVSANNTQVISQHSQEQPEDITDVKQPLPPDHAPESPSQSTTENRKDPPQGATGGDNHNASVIINEALKRANQAAANAYTTCKEVFYTWQARTYSNGSSKYKPPQSSWKPKEDNYVPPKSTWKPPSDTWSPPQEKIDRPKTESGPMGKLVEMGFCDRAKNSALLAKHGNDVEEVITELLRDMDNNWMAKRH